MASNIRIKRSAVPGKAPVVSDIELGELAVNTYDGKLYLKKDTTSTGGEESIIPLGERGYTGSQGDIGYTGSQGIQGYTGSQGDLGYTGSQGDIGYTGSQGIQGYTGSQGDIGYTGSQGYTGSHGDIGYTGSKGDTPETTVYTADSIYLTGGVYVSGTVADIQTYGDYGTGGEYIFTDSSNTAPAWYVDVGFVGVTSFNQVDINVKYTQNSGHTIYVQLYNYVTATWDSIGLYNGLAGFYQFQLGIISGDPYISSGAVSVRLYHSNGGNPAHETRLDYVAVVDSISGGQGPRGFIGYTGSKGYTGSQGDQGYTGSQGEQGVIGYTGSQGDQGVIGYTGSQGDIGYTGSAGPSNIINATDDTSTTTLYPVLVGSIGADATAKASSSKLSFNAATGKLNTVAIVTSSDVTIGGNLVVQGTTTTVSSINFSTTDNMLYLNEALAATITNAVGDGTSVVYTANNQYAVGMSVRITGVTPSSFNAPSTTIITAADTTSFTIASTVTDTYVSGGTASAKSAVNPDLGFAGGYNDGTYHHSGFFRDASDGVWKIFEGYTPEPSDGLYIDTSHATFALAPLAVDKLTAYTGLWIDGSQIVNSSGEWVGSNTGLIGYTGSQGVIGYTGSQGIQGVIGYTGSQGDQGVIGYTGSQGIQGDIGYTGSQGDIGYTGSRGIIGYTGSQGVQGDIGYTGSQGDIGYTGSQGIQGVTGYTGSKGDQGNIGYTGSQGDQGVIGYTGSLGYTGSKGADGGQLTAGTYVARAVKDGSAQTIPSGSDTVVTFVDDFDPNNWITSNQFKPTVAGYYSIDVAVWWEAGSVNDNQNNIQLRKNGSSQLVIVQTPIHNTTIGYAQTISTIAYFNGSTDYVEVTAYTANPTSQNISGSANGTWLAAALYAYGPQGYTGSQGTQGIQGYTGSIGVIGYTGSTGYVGSKGDIGYTGSQGNHGYTGSQGDQGAIGYTGSQGSQGVIGYTGSAGTNGYTGSQGDQGAIGYTGSQGSQGVIGYTGSQGDQGVIGYTGSKGDQGIAGYTGSTGSLGYTGSVGYTGSIGYTGSGSSVTTSETPPSSPVAGDLWWNSATGNLYIYYTDGDSSQWVPASVGAQGPAGADGGEIPMLVVSNLPASPAANTIYIILG